MKIQRMCCRVLYDVLLSKLPSSMAIGGKTYQRMR